MGPSEIANFHQKVNRNANCNCLGLISNAESGRLAGQALERQAQSKLNRARKIELVCYHTETGPQSVARRRELGMVEEIEDLRGEPQLCALGEAERLIDGEVKVDESFRP